MESEGPCLPLLDTKVPALVEMEGSSPESTVEAVSDPALAIPTLTAPPALSWHQDPWRAWPSPRGIGLEGLLRVCGWARKKGQGAPGAG